MWETTLRWRIDLQTSMGRAGQTSLICGGATLQRSGCKWCAANILVQDTTAYLQRSCGVHASTVWAFFWRQIGDLHNIRQVVILFWLIGVCSSCSMFIITNMESYVISQHIWKFINTFAVSKTSTQKELCGIICMKNNKNIRTVEIIILVLLIWLVIMRFVNGTWIGWCS